MTLTELTSAEKDQYNSFVATAKSGSFLQSWEWGQWQESLGKKAFRFFITDEGGQNVAAMQVVQSPLPLGRHYLYVPYGPVAIGDKNFQFLIFNFQFLLQELKKKFPSAVFVRLEPKVGFPDLQQIGKKSNNIQPGKTLIVDLQQSEEQLLAAMHSKTRYNIKLAQRHGVEIASDLMVVPGHGLYINDALELIVTTADRQSFHTFSKDYYSKFLDFFALQNASGAIKVYLYKALLNRELLAAAVMVDFGSSRTYLFGGSSPHHREAMSPHLLHWQAMLEAKKQGQKLYDFWGVETSAGDEPGFVRFKMGFGGEVANYPGAYDMPCRRLHYGGYKVLRKLNRSIIYIKSWGKK